MINVFSLTFLICISLCCATKMLNSCKCQLNNGKEIDLSPLAKKDGSPRFLDVPDQTAGDTFSYNPCKGFSEGTCNNVAVCQTRSGFNYNCGDVNSVTCVEDESGISLVYSSDDPTNVDFVLRQTVVNLACDESKDGDLMAQGEISSSNYLLFLTSKHACPRTASGLSAGTILIIIFVSLAFVYLIGGVLYQTLMKKATGKERIPNYNLWSNLPHLVKDGSMFALNRVTGKGYSKI